MCCQYYNYIAFSILPDFLFVDRLKKLAEELANTRPFNGQEMIEKFQQKLKVDPTACAHYVGPSYRRTEETLFSILYEWKRKTPTATISQLAQHLLDLGFPNIAYKLDAKL